jgi:hypothetical protein
MKTSCFCVEGCLRQVQLQTRKDFFDKIKMEIIEKPINWSKG